MAGFLLIRDSMAVLNELDTRLSTALREGLGSSTASRTRGNLQQIAFIGSLSCDL